MVINTFLITGAGTGFGKGIAFELAKAGHTVIAAVETLSEVSDVTLEAQDKGIEIQVEKIDITDPLDRERVNEWEIDVLLNNAGIAEGGSLVDIPEKRLRNQFEVNVFGTILLTQKVARKMIERKYGKIIFMSSVSGLMSDPFSGPYGGSKFALEGFAESLSKELQEFGVQVATINPGPFLTGFNDREFETWKTWQDDPAQRVFDYEQLAFPYEQFDPEKAIKAAVKIVTIDPTPYRNVIPKAMATLVKKRQKDLWNRNTDDELGQRHDLVQKSMDIEPATTPVEGIVNKLKDKLTD